MTKKARKQSAFTGVPTMASPQHIAAAGAATAEVLARMDAVSPLKGTVSLLQLRDWSCRWPVGDPRASSFGYCGDDKVPGAKYPYCAAHARIAYLPPSIRGTRIEPRGD